MTNAINHQVRLAARPGGLAERTDREFTDAAVPEPREGEVVVSVLYSSLDPAMRGWMNEGKSYIAPVGIGEVMRAGGGGRVSESKNPKFAVREFVVGMFGIQEYAISDGRGVTVVNTSLAPLPTYLGTL